MRVRLKDKIERSKFLAYLFAVAIFLFAVAIAFLMKGIFITEMGSPLLYFSVALLFWAALVGIICSWFRE